MKPLRFATIGVGGFARCHLDAIRLLEEEGLGQLVAVAENNVEANRSTLDDLAARNVRHYADHREMLVRERSLDAVTVPTGIPFHAPMTVAAFEAGYHVLTEKPPAATIQDLDAMIAAQAKADRLGAVGFQMLSGAGFKHLNDSIKTGKLGKIKAVIGVGQWRRLDSYYERNRWAGRLRLGDRWVLDGPILNPLSHILNNLLFLASAEKGKAASPRWVQAELYKAHPIESEDTSCLTAETENGVRIYFYATLCAETSDDPMIHVIGSQGSATWRFPSDLFYEVEEGSTGKLSREVIDLDGMEPGTTTEVFRNFAKVLRGEESRVYCPLEETRSYQIVANAAFESSGRIHGIESEHVLRKGEESSISTTIKGISTLFSAAVDEHKLFSQMGVPWAVQTEPFATQGYSEFPQRFVVRS